MAGTSSRARQRDSSARPEYLKRVIAVDSGGAYSPTTSSGTPSSLAVVVGAEIAPHTSQNARSHAASQAAQLGGARASSNPEIRRAKSSMSPHRLRMAAVA